MPQPRSWSPAPTRPGSWRPRRGRAAVRVGRRRGRRVRPLIVGQRATARDVRTPTAVPGDMPAGCPEYEPRLPKGVSISSTPAEGRRRVDAGRSVDLAFARHGLLANDGLARYR